MDHARPIKRQVSADPYGLARPELSRFFGIIVRMQFDGHLPPDFHAVYGEYEAQVAIDGPRVMHGSLPPRALGLTMEWTAIHVDELLADWELASTGKPLRRIAPLR